MEYVQNFSDTVCSFVFLNAPARLSLGVKHIEKVSHCNGVHTWHSGTSSTLLSGGVFMRYPKFILVYRCRGGVNGSIGFSG